MRLYQKLILCWLVTTLGLHAQRTTSADLERQAKEVILRPDTGGISKNDQLSISFPVAMIPLEQVGAESAISPLAISPDLGGEFTWQSTTTGTFTVKDPVTPGQRYTVDLAEPHASWKASTFIAPVLDITSRFHNQETALPALPLVDLRTNYNVAASKVAETVYFQERDGRKRFSTAVILSQIETAKPNDPVKIPTTISRFHVTPAEPLPAGATYELIIEGLTDAATGTQMPGLKSISLGTTQMLEITSVDTISHPLDKPAIVLSTSGPVDHDTLNAESISITPQVENLTFFADGNAVRLKGDFDSSATYEITLGPNVISKTGYPIANPGPHKATFEGLVPVIVFPQTHFYQRSALGLNVTVLQSNCPETTWRLSSVPMQRLTAITGRLKEFEGDARDPFTGRVSGHYQTELLTDVFDLKVTASGTLPATASHEALYREIRWQPEAGSLPVGAYLLETAATLSDGRIIGNRCLLYFNEIVLHRKFSSRDLTLTAFSMAEGHPIANAEVEVIDSNNALLANGTTNDRGTLTLSRSKINPKGKLHPAYILVRSEQGNGIQPYQGARFISSGYIGRRPSTTTAVTKLLSDTFADRNLYRPGDTIHVKGTARLEQDKHLSIPQGAVRWSIREGWNGPVVASGETTLDPFGGWEAAWESSKDSKIGDYNLKAFIAGRNGRSVSFQIEEYKPPLFNVVLDETEDGHMQVSSHYFHGSPNAGAQLRWKAYWSPSYRIGGGNIEESDHHSPFQHEIVSNIEREGEARLDVDGRALIPLEIPYEKPLTYGRYKATIDADIISPEGQVISSRKGITIRPRPHYAGIQWLRASDDTPEDPDLLVRAFAFDRQDKLQDGMPMELTIYRRETQTVKERLGANIYRYRNYPQYHSIETVTIKTGEPYRFTPKETGHYIAYGKLTDDPEAPAVSAIIHSVGDGVGRYDVYNDGEITLQLDKKRYIAGQDSAQLSLEAPFGGQAWVTVETDQIMDQFLIDLAANNQSISLPIKPSYHPNVHVSVYLLHPGGPDRLPMERYGTTELLVDRPDLNLDVTPTLTESNVQPGEEITGTVQVLCQGQPVLGTDLTIFAVDEAVHKLGYWQLPDWYTTIYPHRSLRVASYRGLDSHFSKFEERDVTEKGFIIGGGADDAFGPTDSGSSANSPSFRKDFRALAFWQSQIQTDANGEAMFSFTSPDNLTSFHLVAVAQTKDHQFGQGETNFTVSKRLMVEPALTRFVRRGDTVEFRAVVRQNYVDSTPVVIKCQVEGEIEWLGEAQEQRLALTKGLPQVVRFPCRVLGGDAIKVSFRAHSEDDPSLHDAVELSLPVSMPGILQRTGHYGVLAKKEASLSLQGKLPKAWASTTGSYDMTVSHTPYLPELTSMPEVLEYPHGCFEQKSTRYLSYTLMLGLLDYLPELKDRHANYRERLSQGLAEYETALLDSGFMPYWSGSSRGNDWVTVMAYWLATSAKAQGVAVPSRLEAGLAKSFHTIIHGRRKRPSIGDTTRAFALFVHAETGQRVDGMQAVITDLYSKRGELSLDGLTLLTLAMNRYGIMEKEQAQLAKVLDPDTKPRARNFDPVTFGSHYRDTALTWLTKTRLASQKKRRALSDAFLKECEDQDNFSLSTQEHFWKTLLLKEFVGIEKDATFTADSLAPKPDFISTNLASIAWKTQPLEHLQDLKLDLGNGSADRHYFIRAQVLRGNNVTEQEDRGFRLERVVTNLTDASRIGSDEAPYQIGDELLLSYRFHTRKHHHYVALTDELPAGIETVNFNLPQIAQVYDLPNDARSTVTLDHNELRDQSANLYFDHVPPGNHRTAILARVTAAGSFTWPSTQISPMYQPYVGGLTPARKAHSRHDQ